MGTAQSLWLHWWADTEKSFKEHWCFPQLRRENRNSLSKTRLSRAWGHPYPCSKHQSSGGLLRLSPVLMAWESTSQQKLISNTEKNLCFRDFCVVQGDRDTPRSGYRWLSAQGAFLALKQDQALCLLSSTELSLGQTNPKLLWSKAPPHSWMHVIPLPNCSPTQTSIILPVGVSETNTHNFYYFHNGKKKKVYFSMLP